MRIEDQFKREIQQMLTGDRLLCTQAKRRLTGYAATYARQGKRKEAQLIKQLIKRVKTPRR